MSREVALMRREVGNLVAVFLPPEEQQLEATRERIKQLVKEKKEWEIMAYLFFGLFFLLWLSRR